MELNSKNNNEIMSIENLLTSILKEIQELRNDLNKKQLDKNQIIEGKKFYTVSEYSKKHGWPSVGGLRSIIFNEIQFKAQACFKRVGRRVLIDEDEFLKWIETNPKYKIHV